MSASRREGDPTESGWAQAFAERAAAHWTDERLAPWAKLPVNPRTAPGLLRAMGILDRHAKLLPSRVRKLRQINHLLTFLRPALDELDGPLQIVDAGCGRSALGYLVAWHYGDRARVLGIDRNPEVIEGCRERARDLPIRFATADLEGLDLAGLWEQTWGDPLALDGLLALHACDVATDVALALAVRHASRFVAVAPCCQAELARAWAEHPRDVLQDNPHFRRTLAATVTDAMRTELLREAGYETRAVEFVEAFHTPKNTLIYGHLRGPATEGASRASGYDGLVESTGGAQITLARLLRA